MLEWNSATVMNTIIQPHSAHIWKVAIGLFVFGSAAKAGSYVLVKKDIQKRSEVRGGRKAGMKRRHNAYRNPLVRRYAPLHISNSFRLALLVQYLTYFPLTIRSSQRETQNGRKSLEFARSPVILSKEVQKEVRLDEERSDEL